MLNDNKINSEVRDIEEPCCTADTGCYFDGCFEKVDGECIFVDKVYDSVTFKLQGLQPASKVPFGCIPTSRCGPKTRIVRILDIRSKKYFNPDNINDRENLTITPKTTLSGAQFVTDECGERVAVPGSAGILQYLIYADTSECDEIGEGTPVFGSQKIIITGCVLVEIDIEYIDSDGDCRVITLTGRVPVNQVLTNFFELCMPSVYDSAFLPQFTEFCNILFLARLSTQSIQRDINFNPITGEIYLNLIVALCLKCEKKIKVPVQLCVLSTGFCEQESKERQICGDNYPPLFPPQINEPYISRNKKKL